MYARLIPFATYKALVKKTTTLKKTYIIKHYTYNTQAPHTIEKNKTQNNKHTQRNPTKEKKLTLCLQFFTSIAQDPSSEWDTGA